MQRWVWLWMGVGVVLAVTACVLSPIEDLPRDRGEGSPNSGLPGTDSGNGLGLNPDGSSGEADGTQGGAGAGGVAGFASAAGAAGAPRVLR